jgi:hypothetical protein
MRNFMLHYSIPIAIGNKNTGMLQTKEMEIQSKVTANENVIESFRKIAGKENVFVDEEHRTEYGHDKTEDYQFMPDVVIKPGSTQESARF